MFYHINSPETLEWLQINASYLNSLLEKFMWRDRMVESSIRLLKANNKPKILNLGGFSLEIENLEEVTMVIMILEDALRI